MAARKIVQAGRRTKRGNTGPTLTLGTIKAVHDYDGNMVADVTVRGADLLGLDMTVDCVNAQPGDRCVIQEQAHHAMVTGILAKPGAWVPVTQLTFHKHGQIGSDPLSIGGYVVSAPDEPEHGWATITCRWQNNGQFGTGNWAVTPIATFDGWRSTREAYGFCAENVPWDNLAMNHWFIPDKSSQFSWLSTGTFTVGANCWHNGMISFPVERT